MRNRMAILIAIMTGAFALAPASGWAYPVNEVLRRESDRCGRDALLRRGYWNADSNRGFGFDKMYHKHNLKHTGVFAFVLHNPNCGEPSGGQTRKYDAYAHRVQCSLFDCEVVEIRRVYLIVDYRNDPAIPGQKGAITAYCGNEERCADWVDSSINVRSTEGAGERAAWSYEPMKQGRKYRPSEVPVLPPAS